MIEAVGETPQSLELQEMVERVAEAMSLGPFSTETRARLGDLMRRFAAFALTGYETRLASAVTPQIVEAFVRSLSARGSVPAVATMHVRRSAVRLLFAEGRSLGLVDHDPSMDLLLPPRSSLGTRPLTDDEVALCRTYSANTMFETRQPAAWALAEATARSAEIAVITVGDVDLDRARVWIPGSTKTDPRWGYLDAWGQAQVERRLKSVRPRRSDTPLVCVTARTGVSRTSSASTAIADTMRRAGLHQEVDVRPPSVAAWAGRKALKEGEPIEGVALMLGIRSLDRAASFIDWDWRQRNP